MIRNGEADETETPVNTLSRKLRIGLQTRDGPDTEVPGGLRVALGKTRPERGSVCESPVLQTQDLSQEGAKECKTVSQLVISAATF